LRGAKTKLPVRQNVELVKPIAGRLEGQSLGHMGFVGKLLDAIRQHRLDALKDHITWPDGHDQRMIGQPLLKELDLFVRQVPISEKALRDAEQRAERLIELVQHPRAAPAVVA